MAKLNALSKTASEIIATAIAAKVSAANAQFVPSYKLEVGHTYVLALEMLNVKPSEAVIKLFNPDKSPKINPETNEQEKKIIPFMECTIADVTDENNIVFKTISNGQLYNIYKTVENERMFRLENLVELGHGDKTTPSLELLVTALDQKRNLEIVSSETRSCEMFDKTIENVPFFTGSLVRIDDDIMEAFKAWKK